MPFVPLQGISIVLVSLGFLVAFATFVLARAHLGRVKTLALGQTSAFVRTLSRLPASERLLELKNRSSSQTIAWRIADEALRADETQRAAVIDDLLSEIALQLEARALWPRAAVRIAGASGVLLMAVSISLRVEVFVPIVLLLNGIFAAVVCMMIQQQAETCAKDVRRDIDALIDALGLRESPLMDGRRNERRGRRRSAKS